MKKKYLDIKWTRAVVEYFSQNCHWKTEDQTRARDFCDQCLKPALVEYVYKVLGVQIVDDILSSEQSITYRNRSFFQFELLKKLLEESNFDNYVKYISTYEEFVQTWIRRQLLERYSKMADLGDIEKKILSPVIAKVREALKCTSVTENNTVSDFLDSVCKELQKDLVISRDNLVGIRFISTASAKQFSDFIPTLLPALEHQILAELKSIEVESKLSNLPLKPVAEIFKQVFGCGTQCPFCKVPCEAGAPSHQGHFASVHRPQGLGQQRNMCNEQLVYDICSSAVAANSTFQNSDTKWNAHPYKEYRDYYPDWSIQPDPSIAASSYWKFVFQKFNQEFAKQYNAKPADLPEDWGTITKDQALESIKQIFNRK
uniref:Interferon-induced very large GTPase 1 n=1 Tax=Chelydra serpentina TaxID=8475 RepID=A0A8C3SP66_CHESE